MLPWLLFAMSAAIIVVAGTKLSRYGDQLAEHTGLGGLWVGVLLMAGATSLPEVLTVVSAAWIEAPDIAAGDLFGACMTNMLTLGLIDLAYRQKRVWQQAALGHTLVASLAVVLVALAGLCIVLKSQLSLLWVGVDSLALLLIYVLGMRVVFRQEDRARQAREREKVVEAAEVMEDTRLSRRAMVRRATMGFSLSASALLVAAPILAVSADRIAEQTGIGATFIGTSLVALATSLPELVTSFAAVRLGAFDLAVGNLYGSNAFNMSALFYADLAYGQGPMLSAVSETHAVTALIGILLMNVGLMGIIYRAEKRYFFVEPDSLLMILGYALGMFVVFRMAI